MTKKSTRFKVIPKGTDQEATIDSRSYDPDLHEFIEVVPEDQELTANEEAARIEADTAKLLAAAMRANAQSDGSIDRSKVGGPGGDRKPADEVERCSAGHVIQSSVRTYMAGEGIRTRAMAERQYDKLKVTDPQLAAVRSYESDIAACQFLRAQKQGNYELMARMEREAAGAMGRADVPLQVGVDADGGYLSPTPVADTIAILREKHERIYPRATKVTSPNSNSLTFLTELVVGAVSAEVENVAMESVKSTWAPVTLTKVKAGRYILIPNELIADQAAAFSVVNMMAEQAARKLGAFWEAEHATEAATHITGGLEDNGDIDNTAGGGALTRAVLTTLFGQIGSQYRGNLSWICNSVVTGFLADFEDTTGRPMYGNPTQAANMVGDTEGMVGLVEGLPVVEVPFAANILMVGDLSQYLILEDGGVQVATDTSVAFAADQTAVRVLERRDGEVLQPLGFAKSSAVITAQA